LIKKDIFNGVGAFKSFNTIIKKINIFKNTYNITIDYALMRPMMKK